ncbi:uncharacterized protein LOC112454731 [Temnothorax curvispinosus]|uniref:Uncharacterized protein LOC112454731 n=1 Tax=Temnothorax curvispinosus TaxID=300111 RepID=A0A6J1PQQ1_9HYME|nr:uncharacterized protein LOC112454731 [Temnothorax curvispinosus]
MTDKEKGLANLKRKRATIKTQLTKFNTYLGGFVVNKETLAQLRIRLEKIEQLWNSYSDVQEQIEGLATRHHTRAIFSLKPIEKESSSQLRNLTDCLKQHLEALKALNTSENASKGESEKGAEKKVEEIKSVPAANSVVTCASKSTSSEILLSTAWVHIVDRKGKLHNARALLDNGATLNFITSDLLNKLDLEPKKVEGRVTGFQRNTTFTREMVTATVKSKLSKYSETLTFTVIDQITSRIPGNRVEVSQLQIPESISLSQLADPTFNVPQKVDMLLGATVFWSILQQGRIQLSNEQPVFQKTSLGWILGGKLTLIGTNRTSRICCTITNGDLNEQLERFWEIERCELERNLTPEEVACEKHFESTTYRDENGRFVVSLPLKGEIKSLGDSEYNAMKSLKSMERRFAKDPILHQRYLDFLQEYESMGHMELVPENQEDPDVVYYLPHHGVTRKESDTTKLRVVFNASCRTSSGVSLNDLLIVGPETQPELSDHLLRLRQDDYVLTADIVKMFRQIKIAPRDRALLRILWRKNIQAPIRKKQLTTVTYGTASAAYQAKRCLKQLAIDNAKAYPDAAKSIEEDFYMDDWGTGSKSVKRLQQRKQEVTQILASAGMELQKWHSNASELLPSSEREVPLTSREETKTLGIRWNPQEDTFIFKVAIPAGPCRSKRSILSVIAQIYDPMGLIGPVVVKAKLFMRRLWKLSIDWDDKIPVELMLEWNSYKERLEAMEEIKIPRQAVTREAVQIEMHGFCDASQSAYGACIYLCSIDAKGNKTARLLTSKSRIAPLKILSIPRLELCSAVLLAKLACKVRKALTLQIHKYLYWTNASIVIHWIRGDPDKHKVFVANRVTIIQGLTRQDEWRHVRTKSNPADIILWGIDPRELPKSEMWWSGPPWLRASSDQWPNDVIKEIPEELQEKSRRTVLVTVQEDEENLLERFSSLSKLRRIVAYCYRFVENCRKQASQRRFGPLKVEELTAANTALVKMAQRQAFAREIWDKGNKGKVSRNSRILSLNPFVDEGGVLRVRGRLMNAALSYDQRFPIILPAKHPFSTLLIIEMHYKNLHAVSCKDSGNVGRESMLPSFSLDKNGKKHCTILTSRIVVILLKAKPFKAGRMLRARKFELSREKGGSTSGKRADRAAQEGTKKAGVSRWTVAM